MRLVLDSNVIIAAFAVRGICHALFEYCLENHDVYLCDTIITEVTRNLEKKIGIPGRLAADIEKYLRDNTYIEEPLEVETDIVCDRNDRLVLAAAKAAGASYLITGEKMLLSLGKHEETEIVSPRAFWERARRG